VQRFGIDTQSRLDAVRTAGLLESGPEEAFNRITRLAAQLLGTPMVALTVADDVRTVLKGTPAPDAVCDPDGTYVRPLDEAACHLIIDTGAEVSAADVRLDPRLRDLPQMIAFGARAWLGTPVRGPSGQVVGNLCAMDPDVREWTDADRESLRTLALAADSEIALRTALHTSETLAAESAALAAVLEESLIPARTPRVPGLDIGVAFRAAGTGTEVLGDFYDVVRRGGITGLLIGDVSGHGATAARATAMARSAIRTAAHLLDRPDDVLRAVGTVLRDWFRDGPTGFVTAVYAELHPEGTGGTATGRRVVLAGAGHPHGYVLRRDGTVEDLEGGGTVLGLLTDTPVSRQEFTLDRGDALVLHTDGVTEAREHRSPVQFDEHGVRAALTAAPPDAGADRIARHVVAAALEHSRGRMDDDAGVVVVRPGAQTEPCSTGPMKEPGRVAPS